jgi:hypothetical protein
MIEHIEYNETSQVEILLSALQINNRGNSSIH